MRRQSRLDRLESGLERFLGLAGTNGDRLDRFELVTGHEIHMAEDSLELLPQPRLGFFADTGKRR